ncbi:MAG: hypothetical protein LAO79_09960 [Acidobacteriia bacterium]|nr:hypothetical protein [Terriglobia bacterium]
MTLFPLLVILSTAALAQDQTGVLGQIKVREIGPAVVGGRIDDFAVAGSNPDTIYVATASGGIWKTADGAITWKPIFEHNGAMSIGTIAVAPSNPAIVWAGTGEANNRQSSSWGDGVYKSIDGGETWTRMGLGDSHHIGRIAIDPHNPQIVYVAALGHLWGANQERGLYKTVDGGKTWNRVLFVNEDTGVVDVKIDPRNPDTIFAAAYERRRTPFGFNGGGPASALYKSSDGGATWKKLTKGLPYASGSGDTGRIGVTIYPRDPAIVYAIVQHADGGIFRSEDHGETWTKMSSANPNPPYFSNLFIDPNNDLRIWIAALQGSGELAGVAYSQDGGKTFAPTWGTKVHADFHAMWIDPANSNHMLIGVDGGIYMTRDRGINWDHLNDIAIGQAYQVGYDMARPYHVCSGYQDNGSWWGPSAVRNVNGILNSDWVEVLVGDGFHCQPDLADSNLVYIESQDGSLLRINFATHERATIVPQPKPGEPPYRFEWNAPIEISTHDAKTIYFGAQYLFKSTDRGDTWTTISPDLTTGADRNNMPILGKLPKDKILSRNYGVTWYPCITRIAESPVDGNVVWVGTQDGNLQVTRDGGKSWTNVADRVPGVPKGTYVSGIEASRAGAGAAYVTFDGHRGDDFKLHVFFTSDFGKTWQSVSGNLPAAAGTARVIREDPRNQNLLFAGTEFGAYVSFDRGKAWELLGSNFPQVRVDDIKIHPREHDLIIATHGRSLWILDDITPLEQMSRAARQEMTLFDLRPATSWRLIETSSGQEGQRPFAGANPPPGAVINYTLPKATNDKVTVTILDSQGNVVRELAGTGFEGLNRVTWDLHYPPTGPSTAEQKWAIAGGFFYRGADGPMVEPGVYTVKLSQGANQATKTVTVSEDPDIHMSAEDRAARHTAIMRAYDLYKSGIDGATRLRALRNTVAATTKTWKSDTAIPEQARKDLEAFSRKADDLAPLLSGNPNPAASAGAYTPPTLPEQLAHVLFSLENYSAAPRARDTEQLTALEGLQQDALRRLKQLIDVDLAALNKTLSASGVPYVTLPAQTR